LSFYVLAEGRTKSNAGIKAEENRLLSSNEFLPADPKDTKVFGIGCRSAGEDYTTRASDTEKGKGRFFLTVMSRRAPQENVCLKLNKPIF